MRISKDFPSLVGWESYSHLGRRDTLVQPRRWWAVPSQLCPDGEAISFQLLSEEKNGRVVKGREAGGGVLHGEERGHTAITVIGDISSSGRFGESGRLLLWDVVFVFCVIFQQLTCYGRIQAANTAFLLLLLLLLFQVKLLFRLLLMMTLISMHFCLFVAIWGFHCETPEQSCGLTAVRWCSTDRPVSCTWVNIKIYTLLICRGSKWKKSKVRRPLYL